MTKKKTIEFVPSNSSTWPPLLTLNQVSQILNLSPWTLRQWDNQGKLKAIRVGNRKDRRYRKEDISIILKEGLS
ncbi:MerR family transcriptional regulator [Candidatus Daviesbacteria bacterium]|nr:MerR family transcriptional regulator [Candidatus Daviesbacteria bacterium]